ncbi:MAG: NAD(P)/FAD-dependent oxidoreductase [Gammaproteobacteria bacterium]|nr:NAD(P)/FAD-dependent oxidoreductase [Gammaproteobacteria bacterium]
MSNVLIIGAGIGGVTAAYELRDKLECQAHKITVVDEKTSFDFTPSNPWVGVGWRTRKQTSVDIGPQFQKKDIDFIPSRVASIDAKNNAVTLENSTSLNYDYLVITTGPKLAFDEVPGTGPEAGFTQSVCTLSHAETSFADFQKLAEDPGPVIVGAMAGASCFGPAYEYLFILETELRKRKIRNKVPMTLVTSEPYIGHLGLGGVGDSKSMLQSELRSKHVKWITNAKTTRVEAGMMFVDECDQVGDVIQQHELPFKHAMMLPAFKGIDPVAEVQDLCNPRGFVIIDDYQRNPTYKNIYSAGVCVAIPPVEATPVATGTPKTGYMIESMVSALVHNIAAEINGQEPTAKGSWNAICLADMGNTGIAFAAIPQIPPRNVTWFKKGKWVHLAKVAYEKYFLRKVKKGSTEPVYEKYILKMMGINRLEP